MIYADRYITQEWPDAIYSEIYYLQSNAAGVAIVQQEKQGAIAILTHWLYWVPREGGGVITFNDQFNQPLFSQLSSNVGIGQWAPIFQVKRGATVKISCSDAGLTKFTVSYQFITRNKVK